jgi:hypothetical protein
MSAGCESLRAIAAGLEEQAFLQLAGANGRLCRSLGCWRRPASLSTTQAWSAREATSHSDQEVRKETAGLAVFDLPGEEVCEARLGMLDGALMISACPQLAKADMPPQGGAPFPQRTRG